MPRKKTWRVALVKKRQEDDIRLVDSGHIKNRTRDPTSNITVDGPERLVDPGHVKNRSKFDLGDTASLKRVQNLPSGAMNTTDLPSGAMYTQDLPSGAINTQDLPSGAINTQDLPSGAINTQDLPSGTMNSQYHPSDVLYTQHLSQTAKYSDNSLDLGSSDGAVLQNQKFIEILFASLSQSDKRFPDFSRGVQCTCNALMSIIQENASTMHELDEVLYAGDDLYRIRIGELQSTVQFVSKMLNFEELPRAVSLENRTFEVKYFEQICGTVTHIDWEHSENVLNLNQGIETLFSSYRQGLIIVGGICSAMYRDANNRFVFFDSHSHGKDGLSSVDGTAVKVIFDEMGKLLDFLFLFYHSCGISMTCQFEIQSLSVIEQATESMKNLENAKIGIPLIDKYFQFQETMSMRCSNANAPYVSRKKYMKNYMRKRREQSDEQRQKDRESSLKSKSKARQSKEFQEKELAAKRHNRLNPETKEKNRESTLKSMKKARQSKEFQEKELAVKRHNRQKPETQKKR